MLSISILITLNRFVWWMSIPSTRGIAYFRKPYNSRGYMECWMYIGRAPIGWTYLPLRQPLHSHTQYHEAVWKASSRNNGVYVSDLSAKIHQWNLQFSTTSSSSRYFLSSISCSLWSSLWSFKGTFVATSIDTNDGSQIDPRERLTAEKALQHPYVAVFHDKEEPICKRQVDLQYISRYTINDFQTTMLQYVRQRQKQICFRYKHGKVLIKHYCSS